jgi:hypothetical protein
VSAEGYFEDHVRDSEATHRVIKGCHHLDADQEGVLWLASL